MSPTRLVVSYQDAPTEEWVLEQIKPNKWAINPPKGKDLSQVNSLIADLDRFFNRQNLDGTR